MSANMQDELDKIFSKPAGDKAFYLRAEIESDIKALIASEVKKKEVETHDWYWHHQIYIGAHGIGPVSLENKEKAQAELASLKDTHKETE
jgi:hypothetical protein